jgi:hypothetical protein
MIGKIRVCKCGKEMKHKYTYDNGDRKSVQFRMDICSCGFTDTYITWQR